MDRFPFPGLHLPYTFPTLSLKATTASLEVAKSKLSRSAESFPVNSGRRTHQFLFFVSFYLDSQPRSFLRLSRRESSIEDDPHGPTKLLKIVELVTCVGPETVFL